MKRHTKPQTPIAAIQKELSTIDSAERQAEKVTYKLLRSADRTLVRYRRLAEKVAAEMRRIERSKASAQNALLAVNRLRQTRRDILTARLLTIHADAQ
jgi:multidrug resistance efflux pump